MKDFNQRELLAAKEIITAGLNRAAESLSFFMKEVISFNDLGYYENWHDAAWKLAPKDDPNIHLLVTEVVGELKGVCCLVFSEKEANQLRSTALPPEISDNPEMMLEMGDAIMLEVDNIISASVITEFSNILKHKIHGGVPRLNKLNYEALNLFVNNEKNKGLYSINFKTQFVTKNGNFTPEFLWLFDQHFVESIKAYAAGKNAVTGLNV